MLLLLCRYGSGDAAGSFCTLCPVGYFAVGPITGSTNGCNKCPTGQTTLQPGAGDISDCVCDAGNGWDDTAPAGCKPCAWPNYQGRLDSNLVPVTSATKENPRPPCLICNLAGTIKLGNAKRQCVTPGDNRGPPVYCANQNNPLGVICSTPNCDQTLQYACTP